ncbi:hypothetical protein IBX38_04705 [Candidatus Bathyarchaeota archaeon]|nr:hypothetical protein [Candidatus Bathyarchaeota archaeon]
MIKDLVKNVQIYPACDMSFDVKNWCARKDLSWLHPLSKPPGEKPLRREEDLKYMAYLSSLNA